MRCLRPYTGTCGTPPTGFLPGIGKTFCKLPANTSASASAGHASTLGRPLRTLTRGAHALGDECQRMGPGSDERCIVHTMGFGGMIKPLAEFIARVTRPKNTGHENTPLPTS